MTTFVGIDPGLTGAVAFYNPYRSELQVKDIPLVMIRDRRWEVDLEKLYGLWPAMAAHSAIERVGAMPKQGVSSAFHFGDTYGVLRCTASYFSADALEYITPQQWKFGVGLSANPDHDKKARKNASRQRASELFPKHAQLFQRVKDDGRAEAALLAWYLAHRVHGVPMSDRHTKLISGQSGSAPNQFVND